MKSPKRPPEKKSPKGKKPETVDFIDLSISPAKKGSQNSAGSDKQGSHNKTNMVKKVVTTGVNMTPFGTGGEPSCRKTPIAPNAPRRFSPGSLSIGPSREVRNTRDWMPLRPLQIFSSNDFDPPQADERPSVNNNGKNGQPQTQNVNSDDSALTATTPDGTAATPQTPQDVPRRSFSMEQKCKILEICLSIKDQYLALPLAHHHDQESFWTTVWKEKLPSSLATRFSNWKNIKESVESWCYLRRTLLREGRLPALSQAQPELDTLVDSWNEVFVARFCQIHRGYFEIGVWALTKDRVLGMVQDHVNNWIGENLQKRRDELESSVRLRLLSNKSSLTEYGNAVKSVQEGFTASKRDQTQTVESEAVLSMTIELRPELEKAMSKHFNGPRQSHQERTEEPHTGPKIPTEPAAMRRGLRNTQVTFTIPSIGSTSASSAAQQASPRAAPALSGNSTLQSLPESSHNELVRKRKSSEPVPRMTPTNVPAPLGPATSSSLEVGNQSNMAQINTSNDPAKRPRFDNGSSSNAVAQAECPFRGRQELNRPPQRQLSPSRYENACHESNMPC
ncbi:hypothetical protein IL306_008303 [Fusarium sp. DS 682]|nr:hypothetical protein IL306_008303 [Fusarium sp. DS 682]